MILAHDRTPVAMQVKGVKLRRIFQDLEQHRDEVIRSEQLQDLLQVVLPSCTAAEKSFFQAMLDIDHKGTVTYESFFKVGLLYPILWKLPPVSQSLGR